jgi:hypothetical protein
MMSSWETNASRAWSIGGRFGTSRSMTLRVVGGLEQFIRLHRSLPSFRRGDAVDVADHIFEMWSRSAVILRVDGEFANALPQAVALT